MPTTLEDLNLNTPPLEELENHASEAQAEQLRIHDNAGFVENQVLEVADAVDDLVSANPKKLEATQEWMKALSAARAMTEQIFDDIPGKNAVEQERSTLTQIERDLLPTIPDNSEYPDNEARFSELKRKLTGLFESGEMTSKAAVLILSQISETIKKAISETDRISDEDSQNLVSDELMQALSELYQKHQEMVMTADQLISVAKSILSVELIAELEKIEAIEQLLKDITEGSTPLPRATRKRIEIKEELQQQDWYMSARAEISASMVRKDNRDSSDARAEVEDLFAELEESLDQKVEEEIAKLWQDLNPNAPGNRAEILAALYTARKRAEIVASSLRKTLNLATGVEEADSYLSVEIMDILEKADKDPDELERILNEAMTIQTQVVEIRAAIKKIGAGEVHLGHRELAKAIEDYEFTSEFVDGSNSNGSGGTPPSGGSGNAPAAAAQSSASTPASGTPAQSSPSASPAAAPGAPAAPAPGNPNAPQTPAQKKAAKKKKKGNGASGGGN